MNIDIIKNNKIIALFMGGKTSDMSRVVNGYQNIWLPNFGICRWDTIDLGKGKILSYHKSWDWLIPVIDKITDTDDYVKYKNDTTGVFNDGGIYINTKYIKDLTCGYTYL